MNTLITKTPFYVRPIGADGEAEQDLVRLGSGAVLRQTGTDWRPGMHYHPPGARMYYIVEVQKGVDDLDRDWSGQTVLVTPERFTGALVEGLVALRPELKAGILEALDAPLAE